MHSVKYQWIAFICIVVTYLLFIIFRRLSTLRLWSSSRELNFSHFGNIWKQRHEWHETFQCEAKIWMKISLRERKETELELGLMTNNYQVVNVMHVNELSIIVWKIFHTSTRFFPKLGFKSGSLTSLPCLLTTLSAIFL